MIFTNKIEWKNLLNALGYHVLYHIDSQPETAREITVNDPYQTSLDLKDLRLKSRTLYCFDVTAFGRNWQQKIVDNDLIFIK